MEKREIVLIARVASNTYGEFLIRGGLDLMDFSGGLVLPVPSLLQRPVKCDRTGTGTIINAAAAIPAFIRMQYHRRFAFLGMGDINIDLANFYAMVATVTDILVENHRIVGCGNIRNGDYFFL